MKLKNKANFLMLSDLEVGLGCHSKNRCRGNQVVQKVLDLSLLRQQPTAEIS